MEGTLSLDRLHPVRIYPLSFLTSGRVFQQPFLCRALCLQFPEPQGMHAQYQSMMLGMWPAKKFGASGFTNL
jgi:hypothetical protein